MRGRVKFALVLAAISLVILYTTFQTESTDATNQTTRYYFVAFAISAAFPIALLMFSASQRIDSFSFGALVFAVLLQVVLYMGWAASPQEEADRFFYMATAFPFALVATTLLFNALQRDA